MKYVVFSTFYVVQYVVCCDFYVSEDKIAELVINVASEEACRCVYIINNENTIQQSVKLHKVISGNIQMGSQLPKFDISNCVQPLYVLLNASHISRIRQTSSMRSEVWLLLDNSDETIDNIFRNVQVTFDANVIVAKFLENKTTNLYSVYRIAKHFPLRITQFQKEKWRVRWGSERYNLEGLTLKTVVDGIEPVDRFFTMNYGVSFVAKIWEILEESTNCSSEKHIHFGPMGAVENGSWRGLIKEVLNDEYDVILSDTSMSSERLDVLEFLSTLIMTKYQVFYKESGMAFGFNALTEPFEKWVWIAIGGWIILGGSILYVASQTFERWQVCSEKGWRPLGIIGSTFFILQTLSSQGCSQVPTSTCLRIVFFLAYIVSAVLSPSYSASLISSLTHRSVSRPINSMEELLNSNYYLYVHFHSADYNFFTTSKNPVYKEILKRKLRPVSYNKSELNTFWDLFEICESDNYAVFAVEKPMDYKIYGYIDSAPCPLLKLNGTLPVIHQSISFKKGNPYTTTFNKRIIEFKERGLIQRTDAKNWITLDTPKKNYGEIHLSDVSTIFIIYAIGAIIAFLILICEIKKRGHDKNICM